MAKKSTKSTKPAKVSKKSKKESAPVAAPAPAAEPITMVAGNPFTANDMSYLGDAIQIVALLVSEALMFPTEWQEHDGDVGQTFFRAVHVVARSMSGANTGWNPIEMTRDHS